jgi:hypothetical protein
MRGATWIGLLPVLISLLWIQPTFADKRVALVIGNGAYQNATQLPNPARDADAIAELFRKGGFDVVQSRLDLGNVEFKRALRELNLAAINSDIAVVFFAGHGIEINGVNYLLPIDAKLKRDFDVEDEAVTLDRILRAVEPAKKLRLVVLDACRENPFVRTVQRTAAIRSVVNGLGKVEPTMSDTLIAYAAKAGSISADGDGTNSPFTTALLKHLMEPGLDIRLALGRVRDEVLQDTNNQQEPFVYGSLGGTEIVLVPAKAQQTAPISAPKPAIDYDKEMELVFWNAVKDTKSRGLLQSYLDRYPAGNFAGLAKVLIKQLEKEQDATRVAAERDTQAQVAEAARVAAEAKRADELRKADALRRKEEEQRTEELKRAQAEARAEAQRAQDVVHKAEAERLAALREAEDARREAEAARAEQLRLAKLAPEGGPAPKPATVAGLPTDAPGASPAAVEPENPETRQAKLARALQTELKRVGCNPGNVDGVWGEKAKEALAEFARIAKLTLHSDAPSSEALQAVLSQNGRVCPIQCNHDQVLRGDACVARSKPKTPRPETSHERTGQAPKAAAAPKPRCRYVGTNTVGGMSARSYTCD